MIARIAALTLVAILALPAGAWAQSNPTEGTTYSNSSSTTYNDTFQTERVDTFLTRITARLDGGALLFDQSFNVAFGNAVVQAAVAAAQTALNGAVDPDPVIVGPTLASSDTTVSSNTTVTETPAGSSQTVTFETYIGPNTYLSGNRDLGGTLTTVVAGESALNINIHMAFLVDRLSLTTDTYLLTERYDLVGFPQQVAAGVPEPGTLGLLGLGLAGMALWRRRKG